MKKSFIAFTGIILLMAFSGKQDNSTIFKQLHGLEGTWIMKEKNGPAIGEKWVKVNNDYLQGKGFYIKGADTIITETVELRRTKNEISYTPTVQNQNNRKPVTFTLTTSGSNMFMFENAGHDFPKRIVYQFTSDKTIHAWVDAGKDAPGEKEDFYYEKVK